MVTSHYRSGCEVVGKDGTEQGHQVHQAGKASKVGIPRAQAKGSDNEGEIGGSNETTGRAKAQRQEGGGQTERKAKEGGRVRKGYTPEPVYGQRCESPYLTSGARAGDSLSHQVAVCSICLCC